MLGRKTLLSLISLILVRLIQGITLILAANKFLAVQFGYLSVAQSLLAFFIFFSDLNLSIVHLKMMGEQRNKIDTYFSVYLLLKSVLVIVSVITFIFVIIFSLEFNIISSSTQQIMIIVVIFMERAVTSFLMVYDYSFQATLKIAKKEVAKITGQFLGLIIALMGILVFENFIIYLLSLFISSLFSLLISIYYGKKFKLTRIKKDLLKKYLKMDLVFLLPFFLNIITNNLGPLIFLQSYDEQLLGVFNIIASFFLIVKELEQILRSLLIPNFSKFFSENKLEEIKKSINLFEKYTAILNGIIIVGGIFFGDYFLKILFGQLYLEKGLLLYFGYLIALLSFSVVGPYTPLIIVAEKYTIYTLNLIFSFIFSLFSWIFLIPPLNILGITLGLWISVIPRMVLIRYYCHKSFSIGKMQMKNLMNLLVILGMTFISLILFMFNFSFLIRIIIFIVIQILFLSFLLLTKLITKEDYKYFINIINPKKMFDYVKEETFND